MLTTDAINDFKDFIDNIIAYAKVTVNGVSEKKGDTPPGTSERRQGCCICTDYPAGKRKSHSAEGTALQQEQQIVG